MKSVLLSIKPKYVELIASGQKTIEVRKTRPKIETPFKCYIYETKRLYKGSGGCLFNGRGKVIGEFVCDRIVPFDVPYPAWSREYLNSICDGACLNYGHLHSYIGSGNRGYAWHISDLKIYDKPKELSEFGQKCDMAYEIRCRDCLIRKGWNECCEVMCKPLKRPPQSWCYVEVGE